MKAAFCAPRVKELLTLAAMAREASDAAEAFYQQQIFNDNKLSNYLNARLLSLSPEGLGELVVARRAGTNAVAEYNNVITRCRQSSDEKAKTQVEPIDLMTSCIAKSNLARFGLEKCKDISFLPY